jgi:hypothetical protein
VVGCGGGVQPVKSRVGALVYDTIQAKRVYLQQYIKMNIIISDLLEFHNHNDYIDSCRSDEDTDDLSNALVPD